MFYWKFYGVYHEILVPISCWKSFIFLLYSGQLATKWLENVQKIVSQMGEK